MKGGKVSASRRYAAAEINKRHIIKRAVNTFCSCYVIHTHVYVIVSTCVCTCIHLFVLHRNTLCRYVCTYIHTSNYSYAGITLQKQ